MAADAALGGVTRDFRRVLIFAVILGVAGLIVALVTQHYVAGVTFCFGIALGFVNTRLTISAAARFSSAEDGSKKPIIFGSLKRLMAITVVALLAAYAFRPDGVATLGGLALFHMLLLGNTTNSLFREVRRTKA